MEVAGGIFLSIASLAIGVGMGAGVLQLTLRALRTFKEKE